MGSDKMYVSADWVFLCYSFGETNPWGWWSYVTVVLNIFNPKIACCPQSNPKIKWQESEYEIILKLDHSLIPGERRDFTNSHLNYPISFQIDGENEEVEELKRWTETGKQIKVVSLSAARRPFQIYQPLIDHEAMSASQSFRVITVQVNENKTSDAGDW